MKRKSESLNQELVNKSEQGDKESEEEFTFSEFCGLIPFEQNDLEKDYLPRETLQHRKYYQFREYILALYWRNDIESESKNQAMKKKRVEVSSTSTILSTLKAIPITKSESFAIDNVKLNKYQNKSNNMIENTEDEKRNEKENVDDKNVGKWHINFEKRKYLTLKSVSFRVKLEHKQHIACIYKFLNRFGYINLGVSPPAYVMKRNMKLQTINQGKRRKIIVIGAGMSGLIVARQLYKFGYDVEILEARNRLGGRVMSDTITGVDFGASIVTGTIGNPAISFSENLKLVPIQSENGILFDTQSGERVNQNIDQEVEKHFNSILEDVCVHRHNNINDNKTLGEALLEKINKFLENEKDHKKRGFLQRAFHWHIANLEYGIGSKIFDANLHEWDQDDENELPEGHYYYSGGYSSLAKEIIGNDIKVTFGRCVEKIDYSKKEVVIYSRKNHIDPQNPIHLTDNDDFEVASTSNDELENNLPNENFVDKADAVVVTVSLGVLKDKSIHFIPKLPTNKEGAIDRLGFGLLNKVVMFFEKSFWDDYDYFGLIQNLEDYPRGYLIWNLKPVTGYPILSCLVAGEAAWKHEELVEKNPQEVISFIMNKIRGVYGANVSNPVRVALTRWHSDPFSKGTYSFISKNSSASDYDLMAQSVNNQLFFAGEATCKTHPATVVGALFSGLREAGKIDSLFHLDDLQLSSRKISKLFSKEMNLQDIKNKITKSRKRNREIGYKRSVFTRRKRTKL